MRTTLPYIPHHSPKLSTASTLVEPEKDEVPADLPGPYPPYDGPRPAPGRSIKAPLYIHETADYTLIVGREKVKFAVHADYQLFKKTTYRSLFLPAAYTPTREWVIPEVSVDGFERCLVWIYGGGCPLPGNLRVLPDYKHLADFLRAANSSEMTDLLRELLSKAWNYGYGIIVAGMKANFMTGQRTWEEENRYPPGTVHMIGLFHIFNLMFNLGKHKMIPQLWVVQLVEALIEEPLFVDANLLLYGAQKPNIALYEMVIERMTHAARQYAKKVREVEGADVKCRELVIRGVKQTFDQEYDDFNRNEDRPQLANYKQIRDTLWEE